MRVIKKYPNRRLYDTEKSLYITIADVLKLIRDGAEFKVVDADSGEDITRHILVQIIMEQEGGTTPLFTTEMLTGFIRMYDSASQTLFGEFLERNLKLFAEQQKRFQYQMGGTPLNMIQELTEHNLTIWADMQQRFLDMAMGKTSGEQPESEPNTPKETMKKKKRSK